MKNIIRIIRRDIQACSSSVVAIITILGLCIVPCLYAWFNIFSNWDPYGEASTSRLSVAVACEDEGAEALGREVNVGEKVMDGLKGNNSIGWSFTSSAEKAKAGVRSGKYYAALIIPEDFSTDVLSFLHGTPTTPQLYYFENVKKNAIAQKITDKARGALKDEVNKNFIGAMASALSEMVTTADAAGYDPQQVFADLSEKMEGLSDDLETCLLMIETSRSISDSSRKLLHTSTELLKSTRNTLDTGKDTLKDTSGDLKKIANSGSSVSKAAGKESSLITAALSLLNEDITKIIDNRQAYNAFVEKDLAERKKLFHEMQQDTAEMADLLQKSGLNRLATYFRDLSETLRGIVSTLDLLQTAESDGMWTRMKESLNGLKTSVGKADSLITKIDDIIQSGVLDKKLHTAVKSARESIALVNKALSAMDGDLGGLSKALKDYNHALDDLNQGLDGTNLTLVYARKNIDALATVFARLGGSETLDSAHSLLTKDPDGFATYVTSPVKVKTEEIYPVRNYGSAMASFYTVLSQWVCALLATTLIGTKIRRREEFPGLKMHQEYFGRFGLYLFVGLVMAVIVAFGDIVYVEIQCLHPMAFVLAAIMNAITFTAINFALTYALENVGMCLSVLILLVQVAGSGGTFPRQVLPTVFQALYPVMPFHYAMDAMRECIGGFYENTYLSCMGTLAIFAVGALAFGLLIAKPSQFLNQLIADGKEKSEVMY